MFKIGDKITCIKTDAYGLLPGMIYQVISTTRSNNWNWVLLDKGVYYHQEHCVKLTTPVVSYTTVTEWIAEVNKELNERSDYVQSK